MTLLRPCQIPPFASYMLALTGILFSLEFLWLMWYLDQEKKKKKKKKKGYITLIIFSTLSQIILNTD